MTDRAADGDPGAPVPQVPEQSRFCRACDGPVGRGRDGRPGRPTGTCPWCGARFDLRPTLAAGDVLTGLTEAGRYVVDAALVHGARGWLYRAHDAATGAPVVLSRLDGPEGPAAGGLAVAEPELLLALDHPGLVHARDVATAAEPAGPARHLVLDPVEGEALDVRRARGPLAPATAAALVLAALPAVGHLHRSGLLHADLNPSNLLAGGRGVTVMDLGSLRRVEDRAGDVWGRTGFLAPEIAPGGAGPSVASDVYALGRTLAVLTLEFDPTLTYALRLPDPDVAPPLRAHPELARVLARATDPDPAGRPAGVDALAADLRVLAGTGHGTLSPVSGTVPARSAPARPGDEGVRERGRGTDVPDDGAGPAGGTRSPRGAAPGIGNGVGAATT